MFYSRSLVSDPAILHMYWPCCPITVEVGCMVWTVRTVYGVSLVTSLITSTFAADGTAKINKVKREVSPEGEGKTVVEK